LPFFVRELHEYFPAFVRFMKFMYTFWREG
jgi:hypothetical protein